MKQKMKSSQVIFKTTLPTPHSVGISNSLIIYDKYFDSNLPSLRSTQSWLRNFPFKISFESGEALKDLTAFPQRVEQILELVNKMAVKDVQIVSFGGGSIGDFAGFVASVIKRGLPLVHIPTTWLSAMDSAHGGKTALNVAGFKNQIGSFYPAERIYIIKSVLDKQPDDRCREAFGEAIKMAILLGGKTWKKFSQLKTFNNAVIWSTLPEMVKGKYRIVNLDPFEKKGVRQLLNLGHTLGHIWEAEHQLPHGVAVGFGVRATIEFSNHTGVMSEIEYKKLRSVPVAKLLPSLEMLSELAKKSTNTHEYLLHDKKISKKNSLKFVLIRKPGQCVIKEISIASLVDFHESLMKVSQR